MAQARRSTGAGARRRTTGAAAHGAQGTAQHEPRRDRPASAHDHSAHGHDRAARTESSSGTGTSHSGSEQASSIGIEQLQEMAGDMAPQLGAAAVAAIATAVVLPEFLPAVLIGAGATLAPKLLPGMGAMFRPAMRTMMRAGYAAFSTAQHFAAEAGEQMQDVIAEVQAERRARSGHRPNAAGRGSPEAGAERGEAGAAPH